MRNTDEKVIKILIDFAEGKIEKTPIFLELQEWLKSEYNVSLLSWIFIKKENVQMNIASYLREGDEFISHGFDWADWINDKRTIMPDKTKNYVWSNIYAKGAGMEVILGLENNIDLQAIKDNHANFEIIKNDKSKVNKVTQKVQELLLKYDKCSKNVDDLVSVSESTIKKLKEDYAFIQADKEIKDRIKDKYEEIDNIIMPIYSPTIDGYKIYFNPTLSEIKTSIDCLIKEFHNIFDKHKINDFLEYDKISIINNKEAIENMYKEGRDYYFKEYGRSGFDVAFIKGKFAGYVYYMASELLSNGKMAVYDIKMVSPFHRKVSLKEYVELKKLINGFSNSIDFGNSEL